jgi:hypothetical protein
MPEYETAALRQSRILLAVTYSSIGQLRFTESLQFLSGMNISKSRIQEHVRLVRESVQAGRRDGGGGILTLQRTPPRAGSHRS